MKKKLEKYRITDLLLVFTGTFISAIGILFFLESGKGIDPLSTFLAGITNFVPLSLGTVIQIFNVSVVVTMFFVQRNLVGIGSLINGAFVGIFVNITGKLVSEVAVFIPWFVLMCLGPILLGFGTAVYLKGNLGSGALECLMLFISKKSKLSIKLTRSLMDLVFVGLGFAMGAVTGVATVLGIFTVGPVIEGSIHILSRKGEKNGTKV